MKDFISKKEKLIELLENYLEEQSTQNKNNLTDYVNDLKFDEQLKNDDFFKNMFKELTTYLEQLSRKEIKQRILMIKSYDKQ